MLGRSPYPDSQLASSSSLQPTQFTWMSTSAEISRLISAYQPGQAAVGLTLIHVAIAIFKLHIAGPALTVSGGGQFIIEAGPDPADRCITVWYRWPGNPRGPGW